MTANETQWQRLGELLIARRVELGWRNRSAFAKHLGLTHDRTLSDVENHRRTNFDPATIAFLEQSYRWVTGSIRAVLEGGVPTPIDDPAGQVPSRDPGREATLPEPSSVGASPEDRVTERPLKVVRDNEEDNEVLAAIRRDKHLSPESKAHFLNQYALLVKASLHDAEQAAARRFVAESPATSFDPELEKEIDADVRRAGDENPDSPYRDK